MKAPFLLFNKTTFFYVVFRFGIIGHVAHGLPSSIGATSKTLPTEKKEPTESPFELYSGKIFYIPELNKLFIYS